jgi:hypothetical protein
VNEQVAIALFMHQWRIGFQGGLRIGDGWQIFVFNLDQARTRKSRLFAGSCHQSYFIALKAHYIVTEHWLVGIDKSVGVMWYIGGCEHGYNIRMGQSCTGINLDDASMRTVCKNNLEM